MSSEHYNTDDPPTLFIAGTRRGKAIGLDTSTIRPCGGVFIGRSKPSISNGNERELIAVKLIPDDRSREPRNGRREAELLAKISHPNVRSRVHLSRARSLKFLIESSEVDHRTPQFLPRTEIDRINESSSNPLHSLLSIHPPSTPRQSLIRS